MPKVAYVETLAANIIMKHILFLTLLIFTLQIGGISQISRQINSSKDLGFSVFSIKGKLDSIHFVVSDTSLKIKKSIFIFCQGSLPYALFFKEDSTHAYQQAIPFDYKKYLNKYYFIVISKPAIPIFTTTADKDYFYIDPKTKKTPRKYYQNNYLDYYVEAASDVISYLIKQKWVDKSKIIVAGHSQGSKIVSKLGAINKNITHVIYLSGNPLGRFDQGIREQRRNVLLGKMSSSEAQHTIDTFYLQMKKILANRNNANEGFGDSFKSIASFSDPLFPYILKINVPFFAGYGTNDITSDYCDLLPLDFMRLNKTNLTLMPYLDCDHNFIRIKYNKKGEVVSREELWDKVAEDFFTWLKD